MVEVVVTSIIFIIASFGIFTTITALRPQASQSSTKLEAFYIGKQTSDELRAQVDARVWDDGVNPLTPGTIKQSVGDFNITYTVTDVPSIQARKLEMTIDYQD